MDKYTKSVLTIIAIALVSICFQLTNTDFIKNAYAHSDGHTHDSYDIYGVAQQSHEHDAYDIYGVAKQGHSHQRDIKGNEPERTDPPCEKATTPR